jgi:hypothetical protein
MTSETITAIRPYEGTHGYGAEAGFQVETTDQVITLAIDDEPCCCESWGYFLTEDDADKFVGAVLLGVEVTDTNRSTKTFNNDALAPDDTNVYIDDGDVLFVDIRTDRGTLQFVAYNAHNGYYGHTARVSSKQLAHEVVL